MTYIKKKKKISHQGVIFLVLSKKLKLCAHMDGSVCMNTWQEHTATVNRAEASVGLEDLTFNLFSNSQV